MKNTIIIDKYTTASYAFDAVLVNGKELVPVYYSHTSRMFYNKAGEAVIIDSQKMMGININDN